MSPPETVPIQDLYCKRCGCRPAVVNEDNCAQCKDAIKFSTSGIGWPD